MSAGERHVDRQPAVAFHPFKAIGSVFRLRRDLAGLIKRSILPGSDLTLDQLDILLALYGARRLGWDDPQADANGYVSFGALKNSLVHSSAVLTRRLDELKGAGLVEVEPLVSGTGKERSLDKRRKTARITSEGDKKAIPVWEKYLRLCENLMSSFDPAAQRQMWETNEALMKRIRWQG